MRKIAFITIAAITLLAGVFSPGVNTAATADAARWTRVNIPAEGVLGGWALASGSDIRHLTAAPDGTLYAYGQGLAYTLYKSTNGGISWSATGQVSASITAIAVSPSNSNNVYYATSSTIYRSTDGGVSFIQLPPVPGAGAGNVEITSLAVTWLNDDILAVATRDTDASQFGAVYTLDTASFYLGWVDTSIGGYDVYTVVFSPNYALDRQLSTVSTNETATFVMSRIGNSDWGVYIANAVLPSVAVTHTATIAFPAGYNGLTPGASRYFYAGLDSGTGTGDVYKIACLDAPSPSTAIDLNVGAAYGSANTDVTGLVSFDIGGASVLTAGTANSTMVYSSRNGGATWIQSTKMPTGGGDTEILFSPDFAATGKIYAATTGAGSALSVSRDFGNTWNQISLIDTTITGITSLAPSPAYAQDGTLFLVTSGVKDNLWRSRDSAVTWERVFSASLSGVDSFSRVILPPLYDSGNTLVFIGGTSGGAKTTWESVDNGQSYQCHPTHDPATGANFNIDAWAMSGSDTLYIAGFNGTRSLVYRTSNGGFFYNAPVAVGNNPLFSIAVSPDNSGYILAGTDSGWAYLSSDNGTSYQPLPPDAVSAPLAGNIAVAFDPAFAANHIVYAAADGAAKGIYRFTVGQNTAWESIDATLPAGATVNYLTVSAGGVLYGVNTQTGSGLERCLNPRFSSGATFETVTDGLPAGFKLGGIWQRGSRLWAVDTASIRLMTYNDTLTSPPVPSSPANAVATAGSLSNHTVINLTLDWDTLDGATSYDWQCSPESDFSTIPTGLQGTTASTSVHLPDLDPATTYYWRVRASAPVLSPWSSKCSFTTSLDTEIVNLKPETPAAGAKDVSIRPVFQWTGVIGAQAYELLVATDINFSHPVIVKVNEFALPSNVWQCDVSLDYGTTYYWKVRATASGTNSVWSSAGVFTTLPSPSPIPTTPASTENIVPTQPSPNILQNALVDRISEITPTTPPPSQVLPPPATTPPPTQAASPWNLPPWLIYFVGALLGIVFLSLVIVLAVVLKIKRIG